MAGTYFRGLRSAGQVPANISATKARGIGSGGLRRHGVWRNSSGRASVPVEAAAAGGCKTVAGAYFRGRRAWYDPKVILGATTVDLKSVHILAPKSHNTCTLR